MDHNIALYESQNFHFNISLKENHILAIDRKQIKKERTRVVVFIPSPLEAAGKRARVQQQFRRENWSRSDAVMIFVIGSKTGKYLEQSINTTSVLKEDGDFYISDCRDYGDEVDNVNGTSSTTCKVYEAIKYIHSNYEADYVWRGADDAYLNLRFFFAHLAEFPPNRLWLGSQRHWHFDNDPIQLKHQPALSQLFGLEQFPHNYMLGMGYAFSWDLVVHIATWHIPPHQTWCEDVMVGMWLNPFRINKVSRPDIMRNRGHIDKGNKQTLLLVHYILPQDWESIDQNGDIVIN